MIQVYYIIIIAITFMSCDTLIPQEKIDTAYNRSVIPYEIQRPDTLIPLSYELGEISGLAFYQEGELAAINDEEGKVFIISEDGRIVREINFDDGDNYEGIAMGNNNPYVVKANGDIFKLSAGSKGAEKYSTPLKHRNDVEGLTYDKNKNHLLLACKDEAGIDEDISGRAVYAFEIKSNKLITEPLLIIPPKELNAFIQERDIELEISNFAPSAIAIHPVTGQIFILSHIGKSLAVYDKNYVLQEVVKLNQEYYKQPEGLCFSPDGKKLFISNEGRGGTANLLIFNQTYQ